MNRIIILYLICMLSIVAHAQNPLNQKILYLQNFMYQNSLYENKADVKLWVNKSECQVEIGYVKFNLNDVKMSYRFHQVDNIHLVGFVCKLSVNCIEMSPPLSDIAYGNGYYFAFKTKQSCYTFMELIGDIRNVINKSNGI